MSESDDDFAPPLPPATAPTSPPPVSTTSRKRGREEAPSRTPVAPTPSAATAGAGDGDHSDSDDDFLPALPPAASASASSPASSPASSAPVAVKAKKKKKEPLPLTRPILTLWELEHAHPPSAPPPPPKRPSPLHAQHSLHLSRLPSAALYERSYLHREQLTHLLLTPLTSFLLTASRDGVLKWWKKVKGTITFVRQYRAHEGALLCLTCDLAGTNAVSIGCDRWLKWFDVVNFDLVHMIQLTYDAAAAAWVHEREGKPTICVSSRTTPEVFLYHNDSLQPVQVVDSGGGPGLQLSTFTAHTRPVCLLVFHPVHPVAVSVDLSGVIDYWSTVTFTSPTSPIVSFTSRLDTDLYTFARLSLVPTSLTFSHSGSLFVTTSPDRLLRLFRFSSAGW